ncbi:hypothetical protein [Cesiribacter sp. SM1]|uniref:phosphoribosyltransferase-like protein n=1 Tax=Cesiribacter sp. SM1 TaxID=2861196 RepID=UPI001CD75895|nr:hypothetical protein [Cesiribacter sp. SM1]
MTNLQVAVIEWSADENGNDLIRQYRQLNYLADNLYNDYEPTKYDYPEYKFRLTNWLDNINDDELKKKLFKLAAKVFYINQEGISSLNRTAYLSIIKRWIFEESNLKCDDPNLQIKLEEHLKAVWYTSLSDSMRINSFYKVNSLSSSHEIKADWRSTKAMSNSNTGQTHRGDIENWRNYVQQRKVKYIVVLEDFVGTGKQSKPIIKSITETFPENRILFVPLLICQKGLSELKSLEETSLNLKIKPVIVLPSAAFISWHEKNEDINQPSEIEKLQTELIDKVTEGLSEKKRNKLKKFNLGSLVVMYTNTPNNTSPLIHVNTDKWKGLFPRKNRSDI